MEIHWRIELMNRRMFLRITAMAPGAMLATTPMPCGTTTVGDLLRSIPDPGSAAAVGHAYLQDNPDEADVERLLAGICPPRHGSPCASRRHSRMADELDARIRDDFIGNRTVLVRGWLLAQTEARLYALASLAT
jgi:hypothetical protein